MLRRGEKYLMRLVMVSLILVVVAQGLMTDDSTRFYMSWSERMEGQNLPTPVIVPDDKISSATNATIKSPEALLTIELSQYASAPQAKILINGQARYRFSRQQVLIRVKAGDTVEIDTSDCPLPLNFKITSGSSKLAYPKQGQVFSGNQSIVMIGRIIVK
jgi:hypothetical protein